MMTITGFLAAVSVAALAFWLMMTRTANRPRQRSADYGGSTDFGGTSWNFVSGSGGDNCASPSDSSSSCDSGGDGGGGGGDGGGGGGD